ncbi:arrestin-like protein [Vairimorpha necatrix]|uniref:Arrestin-like protein n=1 Tax=Vairimorpha necatrix TaxID=6039 RepID=A0AAX4JA08_9MICR
MEDTTLRIILDKQLYENDEFITGKISYKSRIPRLIKKISLNLTKSRKIEFCRFKTPEHDGINSSKTSIEYSYNFDIYSPTETYELSSGAHIFPFKFSLKSSDSSTTEIKGVYFDYLVNIINSYTLTSNLFVEGDPEPQLTSKKDIQIVEMIDKAYQFQAKIELSTIMCLLYKSYTLKFFLDKPLYLSGDKLNLTIQMNRVLVKLIKNIECNLYEVLNIQSQDLDIIRTKYLVGASATLEKRNYNLSFRIPSTTPSSVNEDTFGLKILLFININFKYSGPVKIKKYLQIAKRNNELPDLENLNVLDGDVFDERVFVLT